MKHALWLLAAPLLIAAGQDSAPPAPLATLNVRQADGGYKLVDRIDVPADHRIHDGLIAMEGPGWESDRIAYRLYLDERNVPDIYGKKLPGNVLPTIGMGKDDYHSMAPWGQDIFQVDQSLGMGGIGVLRGGVATQLGKAKIRFESGRATIDKDSMGLLDKLIETALRCPTANIEVAGHTDSDGDNNTNMALSEKRAQAVSDYLIKAGLPPDRLKAVGYGSSQPVAANDTDDGKAKNRRIDFVVK